jgi:hypothetical protein
VRTGRSGLRFFLAGLVVEHIVSTPMRNPARLRTIVASATWFLMLASWTAAGQPSAPQIPSQLSFLPSLGDVRKNIEYERWGEKKFPPSDTAKRGQHWTLLVNLKSFTDGDRERRLPLPRAATWLEIS